MLFKNEFLGFAELATVARVCSAVVSAIAVGEKEIARLRESSKSRQVMHFYPGLSLAPA
jgi:hypothetical protein